MGIISAHSWCFQIEESFSPTHIPAAFSLHSSSIETGGGVGCAAVTQA